MAEAHAPKAPADAELFQPSADRKPEKILDLAHSPVLRPTQESGRCHKDCIDQSKRHYATAPRIYQPSVQNVAIPLAPIVYHTPPHLNAASRDGMPKHARL